jgi:predicted permease
MADKKQVVTKTKIPDNLRFTKDNFVWMGIGVAIIALGMILMSGGKTPDPNQFDTSLVYSPIRITVAPIMIVGGLILEIYAIFKKSKNKTA